MIEKRVYAPESVETVMHNADAVQFDALNLLPCSFVVDCGRKANDRDFTGFLHVLCDFFAGDFFGN